MGKKQFQQTYHSLDDIIHKSLNTSLIYNTFQAAVALAEKHQMDGVAQPLSLILMHTPKGMQASMDEMSLRGRAVQLGENISGETSSIEAVKEVGRKLMEEGLGDVEIDQEVVGILQSQGFGTLIALPEGEIVIAYHSLIRRTAGVQSWTFPRQVQERKVVPFLPHLLEVIQMPMKADLVCSGEAHNREENSLRDDIARHIEEPENWTEISLLEFFNSVIPKTSQVRGLKSQPIAQVIARRDPKLRWRDACDNDEVIGEEVFISQPGGKSYVRRHTDIRVLYEGRPEQMREMRLGQLASEYRLLNRTHKEAETIGKDRIAHTKESLAKLEAEVNKYKSDQIEIDQQTNKYEEAIREETKNIKHWKREITKLKLEDIPGEEIEELKNYFNNEEGILELEQLNTESKFMGTIDIVYLRALYISCYKNFAKQLVYQLI